MRLFTTMRKYLRCIVLSMPIFLVGTAHASDSGCEGIALKKISAIEAQSSVLKKGEKIGDLILFSVNGNGQPSTYAQTGGFSYPASAIKLLNCHVKKTPTPSGLGFTYSLVLDNTTANAMIILRESIEHRLEDDGMGEAQAGAAAEAYLKHPTTACGTATKMILRGHTELVTVVNGGEVC